MHAAILLFDQDAGRAGTTAAALARAGHEVRTAATTDAAIEAVRRFHPDIALVACGVADGAGLALVSELRRQDAALPVLVTTAQGNATLAQEALARGAHDVLVDPVPAPMLAFAVARAQRDARSTEALAHACLAAGDGDGLGALVGDSQAIAAVRGRVAGLLQADRTGGAAPVLVAGEPGTGKTLVARAIHFDGPRRGGPFIDVDCGAVPEARLAAMLFGRERDAQPDARCRRVGLVEAAHGGTLFLRRVAAAGPDVQAGVLRLIETQRVRRVGGLRDRVVDVRVIASLAGSAASAVRATAAGQRAGVQDDLLARFATARIELPPLRQRDGDVRRLAGHFLGLAAAVHGKPGLGIAPDAALAMQQHDWPGNVRELRAVVEQAVLRAHGPSIDAAHLAFAGTGRAALAASLTPTLPSNEGAAENDGATPLNLPRIERAVLARALEETRWNVSKAARLLGVTRDTLRYRIVKHELDRPRDTDDGYRPGA